MLNDFSFVSISEYRRNVATASSNETTSRIVRASSSGSRGAPSRSRARPMSSGCRNEQRLSKSAAAGMSSWTWRKLSSQVIATESG
jgi:hypothetical protein